MTSGIRRYLQQIYVLNNQENYLLGDSRYPLEPWLLVPFMNPQEDTPESRFNWRKSATARWRCKLNEIGKTKNS
jgi:hypothetical protein